MSDAKQQWRSRIRRHRLATYGDADVAAASARALSAHVDDLINTRAALRARPLIVAGFAPVHAEADALNALAACARSGHTVLLPGFAGQQLSWIAWDGSTELTASRGAKFGPEPSGEDWGEAALARVDLVFAPAVAVDRSGTRLGHGKGYYDRALAHVSESAEIIAVIHDDELLEAGALPREDHDVPMHAAITESGYNRFASDDEPAKRRHLH